MNIKKLNEELDRLLIKESVESNGIINKLNEYDFLVFNLTDELIKIGYTGFIGEEGEREEKVAFKRRDFNKIPLYTYLNANQIIGCKYDDKYGQYYVQDEDQGLLWIGDYETADSLDFFIDGNLIPTISLTDITNEIKGNN